MSGRLVFAATVGLALATSGWPHEAALSRYNYWEHVRPIFEKHCAGCHRPEGVGPMSLLEYQSAVPWSNAIKLQVLSRAMPPFLPDEANGPFRGARSLTAEELDILVDWTVGATPEGEPIETERTLTTIGEPDVLVEAASDVVIEEDEVDETECVRIPGFSDARLLSAWTVISRAPSVLRRAALYSSEACVGAPVLTWLPDQSRASFPDGVGWEIPSGVSLVVELRYAKGWNDEGARIVDRPSFGLWFSRQDVAVQTMAIDETARLAPDSVALVAVYPDVTAPVRVEAVAPDGTVHPLLVLEAFDPAWREKYVFAEPLGLPAGTELRVSRPAVWVDFVVKPLSRTKP